MALQKQPISIVFNQGVNTKPDPFQIPIGQFQALTNAVFTKDGLLQKRNGFGLVTEAPMGSQTLATLTNGLVALGNTCQSYSEDSGELTDAGLFQPMQLSTVTMVRRATSQLTCDVAIASNGLACSVWLDANTNNYYQISDSVTGQIVIPAVTLPATATTPRVFVLNTYFIVTFIATVSSVATLQYIAIPIANPSNPFAPANISDQASSLTAAYDGTVFNNQVYISLNCSDGGGAIRTFFVTNDLTVSVSPNDQPGHSASLLSVTVDSSGNYPIVWVTFFHGTTVSAFAISSNLTATILTPTLISTVSTSVTELTSTATGNVLTAIYEVYNTYGYTPSPPEMYDVKTDYIASNTLTLTGTAGTPSVVLRGVGLASKAVIVPALAKTVVLATYGQEFQPTYFLIDLNGNVLARLAYSNGIGWLYGQIMPTLMINNNILKVGYLYADLLQALSVTQNVTTTGTYSQYGINLATFSLGGQTAALEIGGTLHASGGMLWQYDGVKIREHGFNVWPEDIEATFEATLTATTTGNLTAGSNNIVVASSTGIYLGMSVVDNTNPTYIAGNAIVTAINGTTITISSPASMSSTGDTLVFTSNVAAKPDGSTNTNAYYYQVTYEWTDAAGQVHRSAPSIPIAVTTSGSLTTNSITLNIPTLRQTYKTDNVVRIVIYRWSVFQQSYHQITSILQPLLNNPAVDYVTFIDTYSDASIAGNNLIYTTGGVIEDICAPGAVAMTLWQSRLFLVDAEDQNLIWFSKQVIEATPVEMSDLLTLYIAPTTGAQGSTGPITALSAMDDKLIIFKRDAIYYINGIGPDNTGSNGTFSDPIFITGTVGCANPQSIVLMPNGIMFQSDKGIWILGRDLSTNYIGAPVESYVNANTVTSALCIPGTNQVRFTMNNTQAVMYDYYFNRWSDWENISAISSVLYQNLHTYLSTYGQIVQETPNEYLDISSPVLLGLTTGWINLAGLQGYERFYFANLLGVYYTPFIMNVNLAYDYNTSATQSVVVTPSNYTPDWGGENVWGAGAAWGADITPQGASNANIFSARIFPYKQKTQAFQVSIQETYDSTLGVPAGQGLTLSGLSLIVGVKKGYRTQSAARSFG